jgi:acyl transferase domain-containing protein/NAD(P)H-dependent flavin oxidoreductase YrpB (nitropropane dioxygenase family)/NAD(P)-dependent dehydrogenase (short-subunit alcohol dehydrogenase family)
MYGNSHPSSHNDARCHNFEVIGITLPCLLDPAIAIAVSRAGEIGVLDLQWSNGECSQESHAAQQSAESAIQKLATLAKGRWGLKIDSMNEDKCESLISKFPGSFEVIILTEAPRLVLARLVARLQKSPNRPRRIFVEIVDGDDLPDLAHIDGLIAKGHESGGLVGSETTFVLLQRLMKQTSLAVWAQGGIGLHSAAACIAAGAAGVVLDGQLSLTRESSLPGAVRQRIAHFDGSDTVVLGQSLRRAFRCYRHSTSASAQELQEIASGWEASAPGSDVKWRDVIRARIGWGEPTRWVWPLGQDAVFASQFAQRFESAGRVVVAIRKSVESHLLVARLNPPLAEGSNLAVSHGTRFPIVQGPMTRVSDNAAFAFAVARDGALPFVALALSTESETRKVLSETSALLAARPWGVGILGFVPIAVRQAQLEVIREVRPPFALIAGGRPDQALSLEREGIATYLHTPSPELLKLFFEQGARRFVFEGRECGGHVGPRCSFVLWDEMIEALLSLKENGADLREVHLLFAGGVHDALSASMASAMVAPLAQAGAKIGVLLGTAYLFTREAVETKAITLAFQKVAMQCRGTTLLESGVGHATRCAPTAFVELFEAERRRLQASGASTEEMQGALEELNLGRLRIAAKGVARNHLYIYGSDPQASRLQRLNDDEQCDQGMFMLGQIAALRSVVLSIAELHADVSTGSSNRLKSLSVESTSQITARPCDIAIIGVSTLLPKAPNARQFWENILGKVDAITEIPEYRFDWKQYYDPDPTKPDKIYSKWGGFVDDVPFDPMRYGMPPQALSSIEPMQLLTLEAVRAAIEDAGYANRPFLRSRTSVVLGAGGGLADLGQQYGMRSGLLALTEDPDTIPSELWDRFPAWTEDSFAGLLLNVAAGRVANRFDLGGVNFTVDAACASSLAAIYCAVRELESGSSDMVIAGGVDTVQNPFGYLCFSKTKALSPRGRCRPFDADADGIVISEGIVILILKRLADAERDGDRIYSVIKSLAGSSDGREKGLTAPRPKGQEVALRRAYELAGLSPQSVGLIEAHGTGTVAGDLAEVEALKNAFAGAPLQSCAIGSVKSMVGHTKCAAGAAGLVKAATALFEKVLPPTLNVLNPNPKIDFPHSPFFINTEARPWIARVDGQPRRAGVSAFGFGGTNFHAVLEEYRDDPMAGRRFPVARTWPSELLVWSSDSPDALRTRLSALLLALEQGAKPPLVDLACATWHEYQKEKATCLAVIATSLSDLRSKLKIVVSKWPDSGDSDTGNRFSAMGGIYLRLHPPQPGKIAFVFPGQGSQQVDMLAELAVYFPEVREAFEEADRLLLEDIPQGISSCIFPPSQFTEQERTQCQQRLSQTENTQPAMAAACTAMLRLLQSLGLRPDILAGHSYGEYTALAAAGVLSLSSFYKLSAARGKCMAEASVPGTMLAVLECAERIERIIGDLEGIWVANINSPRQTILSGTKEAVNLARERLTQHSIDTRPIPVACAFHSPLVAPAGDRLAKVLAATEFFPPCQPVYSNTTATAYPAIPSAIASQLAEHLVQPVLFKDEIEAIYRSGVSTFVEVGPRSVLTGLIGQILEGRTHLAVATSGDRSSISQLQDALAQLIVHGASLSLDLFYERRVSRRLEVANLLDESRPAKLAHGTWLVNGGRARRLEEPVLRQTRPVVFASPSKLAAEPIPAVGPPLAAGSETGDVLVNFQETMRHFLEVQRLTLTAYLNARHGIRSEETRLQNGPLTPAPSPVAGAEPAVAPVAGTPESSARLSIADNLRELISERTGYPMEMLEIRLNLESDLGIDSIKRIEILGAFLRSCNPVQQVALRGAMEKLNTLKTIGTLAEALGAALDDGVDHPESEANRIVDHAAGEVHREPFEVDTAAALPRFRLTAAKALTSRQSPFSLAQGAILITNDGAGVASRLAARLKHSGRPVIVINVPEIAAVGRDPHTPEAATVDLSDWVHVEQFVENLGRSHGTVAGLIHLLPLMDFTEISWERRFAIESKGLFNLAKASAASLRSHGQQRAVLLAATCLGGNFGIDSGGASAASRLQGGVAGVVKTVALEWPEVTCRVVDLEDRLDPEDAAQKLWLSIFNARSVEVSFQGDSEFHLQIVPASLHSPAEDALSLGENPVFLVTGGARGITAKAAIALATHFRGRFLVVGKSASPGTQEPPETVALRSPQEIRRALIDQTRSAGAIPDLAAIEAALQRLLHDREMRANLRALGATGAEVCYFPCDLANAEEFSLLVQQFYSSFGKIDGVIHGAGIIEDRLVEDKDPQSFDRVCAAKVTGAMTLAENLRPDSLRFIAFFSSVSGRFGNRGQADYAAANEVLNKLAVHLDAHWRARVVAINWGPWAQSNMVGEGVRDQFVQRRVQLIEDSAGCAAFLQELMRGKKGEAEVILGGGPWGEQPVVTAVPMHNSVPLIESDAQMEPSAGGFKIAFTLDASEHRYLADHCLDSTPVLPAAMAVELMAEAASKGWPNLVVTGVNSVRVCKGIVVDEPTRELNISIKPHTHYSAEDRALLVDVIIGDPERPRLVYYRGTVCLADRLPQSPLEPLYGAEDLGPWSITAAEAYGQRLFHGDCFQCLQRIGLNRNTAWAQLAPSSPAKCVKTERNGTWIVDPILLDAGPQLLILWAQEMMGMTALPSRFGEVQIFDGYVEAIAAGADSPFACRLVVDAGSGNPIVTAGYQVYAPSGDVVLSVTGLESTASQSLNRLAIAAVDAVP